MDTEIEIKTPVRLIDKVPFVEGKINRTTVLSNGSGDVVLLALDAGCEIPQHEAHADVLVHVLEGEADFGIDGVRNHTRVGDSILLPAFTPHSVYAPKRVRLMRIKLNV
jgi:cupin region